jgi:hypothetical protein
MQFFRQVLDYVWLATAAGALFLVFFQRDKMSKKTMSIAVFCSLLVFFALFYKWIILSERGS